MMTRKDYALIAGVVKSFAYMREQHHEAAFIAVLFADELQKTNPAFSREKFLEACDQYDFHVGVSDEG